MTSATMIDLNAPIAKPYLGHMSAILGYKFKRVLFYIFTRNAQTRVWKLARVTPVLKNNGVVDVMFNYRPISVIGHIAKMVEQLVRSQLVNYLKEHSSITPDQTPYLKGYSTPTSLHRVIDHWLENINEKQITGVCLLDISKCFDTISHSILIQKLSMYGIKQQELKWLSSYLDRRKQAVLFYNELSSFVDVTCGVPQGSVLGPFLFLLFINDMSQFTTEGCLTNVYAYDYDLCIRWKYS